MNLRILVLIISPIFLIGQSDSGLESKLEYGLEDNKLRCLRNCSQYSKLIPMFQSWADIEKDSSIWQDIIFQSFYALEIYNSSPKRVLKLISRIYPESDLSKVISIEDLKLMSQCPCLAEMISCNDIELEFPHKVNIEQDVIDRLSFCELDNAKSIIEIGAGTGWFSRLVNIAYPRKELVVNEVNRNVLEYSSWKFINSKNVSFVKGSKAKTNIDGQSDRIIIINSFHHFKEKEKMLSSIRNNLVKDGLLILMEGLKNDLSKNECSLKMNQSEILSQLEDNGFKLVESSTIGGLLCLKYKI